MSNTSHAGFHATAMAAVNEALTVLGQDVVLDELSTESANAHARKAAYLYESARVRVLRDHAWSFARRELDVAGGACVPCPAHGGPRAAFPFRCPRPARCARILSCFGPDGLAVHHRLAANEVQADAPVARIAYIADVEDLDKWSPDAYRALVLRLAADLAKPVTGRINERQLQEQAYADQLAAAKLNDARETNVPYDAYEDNHFVAVMRGDFRAAPPWRR